MPSHALAADTASWYERSIGARVQCEVNLELTNRLRQVMRAQRAATGR